MDIISAAQKTSDLGDELMSSSQLSKQQLGKEDFLKLLVTQLQHQDPLKPTDNKDLILQLSQFSTLEQTQNLNDNFSTFLGMSNMNAASALIGKEVTYFDSENGFDPVTGTVDQIKIDNDEIYLVVNGKDVKMSHISVIGNPTPQPEK